MNDQHKTILEIAAKAYPTARTLHVQENSKRFNPTTNVITNNFSSISLTITDQKYQTSTLYHSSPENLLDELTQKASQHAE